MARKVADCQHCRRPVLGNQETVVVDGGVAHAGCSAPAASLPRAEPEPAPAVEVGTLEAAVTRSLREVALAPRDRSTGELARRYARLIDDAAPAAKYHQHIEGLARALAMLARLEPLAAGQAGEHFDKIVDALAAHSVMSDLGPKLLAALVQLGMTPAARGGKTEGTDGGAVTPVKVETEFERLRARRAERAGTRQHGT